MNKKSVSPLITGLCCVAAVTAVSAYMDRSNDRAVSELAAVPSENTAYEVIMSSGETVLSDVTEYITETGSVSSETTPEPTDISSESIAPETSPISENQTETFSETASASAVSENADIPAGDVHVILNTKTKCIHIDPNCQHAKKISDENRKEQDSDISALADLGYWACSKCAGDYRDTAPKP